MDIDELAAELMERIGLSLAPGYLVCRSAAGDGREQAVLELAAQVAGSHAEHIPARPDLDGPLGRSARAAR
ncbi:hypothetical protein ABT336_02620 [Micromonospora sp. NPDC000207]|uniref:hypothetical protein n=1 Tax=Micromonospora sp. NPDC000207 TaxID=3154246 RepID=UPI003330B7DA